ncbi:hypothetical protein CBW24_01610 [Pacificitalea manganoxidans]|uniref:SH3b domain-containing protein n=2 Tax=Pacificitalea manganoxidans TaxID=1411902 RepID=A0A291LW02_9RHOB|nr:hypothetical protein CBW24_01610 [Pacificitalea manganoxidans]
MPFSAERTDLIRSRLREALAGSGLNSWERSFLASMDERFAATGAKTRLSDAQYRKLALLLNLQDQGLPSQAAPTARPRSTPAAKPVYPRRVRSFSPQRTFYAPRRAVRRWERQIMLPVFIVVAVVMIVSNLWSPDGPPAGGQSAPQPSVTQAQPERSATLYVSGSRVNQRQGPGTGNAILGSLQRGAAVKVLGTQGGWTQVTSPLGTGWMASDYLASAAPAGSGLASGKLGRLVRASDIRVIDGDTVSIRGEQANVRLVGFNTPELRSPACQAEAQAARQATDRLRDMLRSAKAIEFAKLACACRPGTQGTTACNYGRGCGTLYVDGTDVGDKLIAEHLAAPYVCGPRGCPRRTGNWCG